MRAVLATSLAAGLLAGCASEDHLRLEGMTPGAGNAIAANTVMQVVDPWQPGVQDTDLAVPAVRPPGAAAGAGAAGTTSTSTTD